MRCFSEQRQVMPEWVLLEQDRILLCICVCVCVCLHLGKSNNLFVSLANLPFYPSLTFSVYFSGGNISAYPGHCGVSAEDHQPDSHHNGARACPNRKYMQLYIRATYSIPGLPWAKHCITFSAVLSGFLKNPTIHSCLLFWNTKYVNTSTVSLKYTLLLHIQEEDQEERGIMELTHCYG